MSYPPPGTSEPNPSPTGYPTAPPPGTPYPQPGGPATWAPEQPVHRPPHGSVPPPRSNVLATTGLVLALVALVLCLIPIINLFAAVLALAGLVLGIVGLVQARPLGTGKGRSIAAIVVSSVAGVGVVVSQVFFVAALEEFSTSLESTSVTSTAPAGAGADETPAGTAEDTTVGDDLSALVFGDAAVFEDGLEVGASVPVAFTPSDTSVGGEGFTQFVRVDLTLTIGTSEAFDPALTYVTLSSGGAEGTQVFDAASSIGSGPSTSLLPGQSVTFPVVFGVTDPADLTMEVDVGAWEYESVLFSTAG
ncbi:hypothetical protein [Oerskovia merdavium]|uniref:DUF4190 domain-containing protein n=1 Tax=Oerskovia merdavium TaxID=2762227 RepID=A0ABR8TYZ7_9CELL|nr:hypothetical protein [Oerskovia merdavium]MBD7980997.1 hypothetical protein [Oerskovia merdavium]